MGYRENKTEDNSRILSSWYTFDGSDRAAKFACSGPGSLTTHIPAIIIRIVTARSRAGRHAAVFYKFERIVYNFVIPAFAVHSHDGGNDQKARS